MAEEFLELQNILGETPAALPNNSDWDTDCDESLLFGAEETLMVSADQDRLGETLEPSSPQYSDISEEEEMGDEDRDTSEDDDDCVITGVSMPVGPPAPLLATVPQSPSSSSSSSSTLREFFETHIQWRREEIKNEQLALQHEVSVRDHRSHHE